MKEGFEHRSGSETITQDSQYIPSPGDGRDHQKRGKNDDNHRGQGYTSGNPVEGVDVTSTTGEIELALSDSGGGQYQTRLETKELETGVHSVAVTATKEKYVSASTQQTLEVEEGRGIPGFSDTFVLLGLSRVLIMWLTSRKT